MAYTYLGLTNELLTRLNEVNMTSANFTSDRGIQTQAKTAILSSIRDINQEEFAWPFNYAENSETLSPGKVRYTSATSFKHINYDTFRVLKDGDGNATTKLTHIDYIDYLQKYIYQEDNQVDTLLNGSITDSATTITVDSTTGFDSTGNIVIEDETISYTGTTSTTFTGCTRGASDTTAASHSDNVVVAQFTGGGVPLYVFRTPDNNWGLFPFPNKTYTLVYEYYTIPNDLSADTDVPTIPSHFSTVIVDGAMYYLYQYRNDLDTARESQKRFKDGIRRMRTLLVNRYDYIRSTYRPNSGIGYGSVRSRYRF